MIKLKDILNEEIPFDKSQQVKAGLEKKYGQGELSAYTFGIELEFEPMSEREDEDKIRVELENNAEVHDNYTEWLMLQRTSSNRRVSSVERWDDSYGPIDVSTFDDLEPEPEEYSYSDVDEYKKSYDDWKEKRRDVENEYSRFERRNLNDYFDEYIQGLINSGDWEDYVDRQNVVERDELGEIQDAISYISNKMGEKVQYGDSTVDTWGVGPDGSNVEIRSKHLNQNEFNLVKDISYYVKSKKVDGGTSAHVHIGLPTDFDAFDLLAITTLVDERAIKQTVGPQRQLASWAKLRTDLNNKIVDALIKTPQNQSTNEKSFILKNEQLFKLLSQIGKYWGTNVAAMSKGGTIEFRYLGSDVAYRVLKWISYFLLLPRIAKSKNRINLDSIYGERLVATRMPGKIMFTMFKTNEPRTRVPMPKEPADVIKQKAFELPSKLDVAKQSAVKKQSGTQ